ncbi:CoA pyrophosphatase [Microbacterium sp. zg.Y1084]|uniref:NUDIX hydrolase n=1 Tax=Microbacterium sp. zg.Y1084 TaxID=2969667 RepID=UPI00214B41C0|nr:CoA pyrophosphatase [Microbacterium sp. zg.Y1084]MCR2812711.1 CoA pyrophosphatase [Microbacterium sp. zg.Y1084]
MPASDAPRTARAQLAALADAVERRRRSEPGVTPSFGPLIDLPVAPGSRPAAVLILFGVLDATPSGRPAADTAVSRDLDVLLLARAATLRSHPGQVAFPGGRVDPGDDGPIAAALREAQEETGLDPSGVEVLGALETIPLAFSRHLVTPVLGWWRHPSRVRVVDEGESAAVFRAPVADLLNPANRGVTVLRDGAREMRGPAFSVGEGPGAHLVWGFTAMVLDVLFDRLGWTEPWDATREMPLALPPDR